MHFKLIRYSVVFLLTFVAILIIVTAQGLFIVLVAGGGPPAIIPSLFSNLIWAAMLIAPYLSNYVDYLFILEFGAFALPAYVEGYRLMQNQKTRPSPAQMLITSIVMALAGIVTTIAFLCLIALSVEGWLGFTSFNFGARQAFNLAVALVGGAVVGRIFFGIGLQEMRERATEPSGTAL